MPCLCIHALFVLAPRRSSRRPFSIPHNSPQEAPQLHRNPFFPPAPPPSSSDPGHFSSPGAAAFDSDSARAQAAALAAGAQQLAEHMAVLISDNARLSAELARRARGEAAWRVRAEEALAAVGPLRERTALLEEKARMLSEANSRLEGERGRLTGACTDGAPLPWFFCQLSSLVHRYGKRDRLCVSMVRYARRHD